MMTNPLIAKATQKIAVDYGRLSIVTNRDGFLVRADVQQALYLEAGLTVVVGSNLALRIHYETIYRDSSEERFVYISESSETIVPDMVEGAFVTDFAIADLFPLFADKSLLKGLNLEELTRLMGRCGIRRISMTDSSRIVKEVKQEIEAERQKSAEYYREQIETVEVDWVRKAQRSIEGISECMIGAARHSVYNAIAPKIAEYNQQFQDWIDSSYFGTLNSSHYFAPKSVNKVLPYIVEAHQAQEEKVALIVVDGLAYWQYYLLREHLSKKGIETAESPILAWLPTITMLSRQAIFRGRVPEREYKQNPANERKLWYEYWRDRGLSNYCIQYLRDNEEFAINEGTTRLAYVTVEMDEKMHSSTDYKDLLSLTENWCPRITEKFETLRRMGFTIYLTSDHGSVLSHGWQPISQIDKVFLYKDGSRGKRHLMYNREEEKKDFEQKHSGEIELLSRDLWLAIRSDDCFEREGVQIITHGGSHFMEVLVPFVTIKWKEK